MLKGRYARMQVVNNLDEILAEEIEKKHAQALSRAMISPDSDQSNVFLERFNRADGANTIRYMAPFVCFCLLWLPLMAMVIGFQNNILLGLVVPITSWVGFPLVLFLYANRRFEATKRDLLDLVPEFQWDWD